MQIGMAIDAATRDQSGAGYRIAWWHRHESTAAVVNGAGMLRGIVAILANIRCLFGKQPVVVGTMRVVTGQAVFLYRRVLPHEWTALFGVATRTQLGDRLALDHDFGKRAMRIVAVRAGDAAFDDGVV